MFKILFKRNKLFGLLAIIFLVLYAAYNPILSKLIQYNMSVAEGIYSFNLVSLLAINLAILVILSLINWFSQYFSIRFYSSSQNELNRIFYKKMAENENWDTDVSKIIKVFNTDIPLIVDSYIPSIVSLTYFVLSFSFGAILIFTLNKIILIYLIVIAFCSLMLSKKMSNRISPSQKKYNDSLGQNSEVLLDIFDNSITRKIFNLDKFLKKKFYHSSDISTNKLFILKKEKSIVTVATDSFAWLLQIGMYIIGAILIENDQLTFAQLIAITQASGTITTPIFWFSNTLTDIYSSKEIRKEMIKMLQSSQEKNELSFNDTITDIQVNDVSFSMKNGVHISPNNFVLSKGNKYVLIGKNGSGKSTIYSALMLNNIEYCGQILANGKDIRSVNKKDYFTQISAVTQTTKLYKGSVLENITSFSTNIDKKKIEQLKKLFLNEEDSFFFKEIETLSGGQKQIVSIARALYKDYSFLVMDEPFSALDNAMEAHILDYLLGLEDKIVLLTLHHYDQVALDKFDGIVILERNL